MGRPRRISAWPLLGTIWAVKQGTDWEGSHLWNGKETLSWWQTCTFGDVYLPDYAAPWAMDKKCTWAGARPQHWFWFDYETTPLQDHHLLKILEPWKKHLLYILHLQLFFLFYFWQFLGFWQWQIPFFHTILIYDDILELRGKMYIIKLKNKTGFQKVEIALSRTNSTLPDYLWTLRVIQSASLLILALRSRRLPVPPH